METPNGQAQPTPQPKYYEAHAESRTVAAGAEAKKITFVVEGEDYKSAWQSARKLTAVGDAHFTGNAWTDNTRTTPMKMIPAEFTVHELKSLQQRTSKVAPVTLDAVQTALNDPELKLTKKERDALQSVIDGLRSPGGAVAAVAPPVQPEPAGEEKAA